MLKTKKEIEDRINYLKNEIIMGSYHDGWTLNGLKKELTILLSKLDGIKKNEE